MNGLHARASPGLGGESIRSCPASVMRNITWRWEAVSCVENTLTKNDLNSADHASTVVFISHYLLPPFDGRAFFAFLSASTLRLFLMSSRLLTSRLLPAPSLNLPILFSLASATLFLRSW